MQEQADGSRKVFCALAKGHCRPAYLERLNAERMLEVAKPKSPLINLLCGPIESIAIAKKFCLPSLCLTAFSAAIWLIIAVSGLFSPSMYGHWAIAYAIVLCLIAWGLYTMRKEAAVAALAVALIGLLSGGGALKLVADIVTLLVTVAAIRGTFAYSLLTRQPGASKDA